jgi:UDP-N-acetylglucosamine--N-acetylmuramyl-(pentapeptide) pyrophosphoryl-undecaprenol N-acetylglucosamine transferase
LTGGGSGGHITPLLSLAREIKSQRPDSQIIYVGHRGDDFDSLKARAANFDFLTFINAGKFRRYHRAGLASVFDFKTLGLNIRDLLKLPGSIMASYRLMRRFKPDVVFSKGGFVAVPVGVAARLRGVPIITHDSDSVPGLANRIVGRWAKVHATGMPPEFYGYPKSTIEYVGIPIDERIKKVTPKIMNQCREQLGLPPSGSVLLLSGGGNGSVRLNELLLSVAKNLLEADLSLRILHITGKAHQPGVEQAYKQKLPKPELDRVMVEGFTPDFYAYSAAADLVVTRAGATTLAELAAEGKACVIIPSPFLTGGHQLKNARQLADAGAAVVADETIEPDEFLVIVNELLSNDHRRFELAKNMYATAKTDAAARLASIIISSANKQG